MFKHFMFTTQSAALTLSIIRLGVTERESERAACRRSAAVLHAAVLQSRQTSLATNTAIFTPVQATSETLLR